MTSDDDTTKPRQIRIAQGHWDAYERVCDATGTTRAADIVNHIRRKVRRHGDPEAIALLEAGDRELEERRARKGGRPRSSPE